MPFFIQANIGTDENQNQIDIDENDLIIFADGFNDIPYKPNEPTQFTDAFKNVKDNYANYIYLLKSGNIYKINYDARILYAPRHNSDSLLKKYSFRILFIDSIAQQSKIPVFYTFVPDMVICRMPVNTKYNNFFYLNCEDIFVGDILLLDNTFLAEVIGKEYLSDFGFYKYFIQPLNSEHILVPKTRFCILNMSRYNSNTYFKTKILFHNNSINTLLLPEFVNLNSDVTDVELRNQLNQNQQIDIDYTNLPCKLLIDNTIISSLMEIEDFKLLYDVLKYNNDVKCSTLKFGLFSINSKFLLKNLVWEEVFHVNGINTQNNTLYVLRGSEKYDFLAVDPFVKAYIPYYIYFQPIILIDQSKRKINLPIFGKFVIEYLEY